jgi:hypothetical protein
MPINRYHQIRRQYPFSLLVMGKTHTIPVHPVYAGHTTTAGVIARIPPAREQRDEQWVRERRVVRHERGEVARREHRGAHERREERREALDKIKKRA